MPLCDNSILLICPTIFTSTHKAFWRTAGYSGEVVTNGGMTAVPNCSAGPLCIVYDACLHNGSPALLGFIGGDIKVEWAMQSVSIVLLFLHCVESVFKFNKYLALLKMFFVKYFVVTCINIRKYSI